jgi:hypothetical protein
MALQPPPFNNDDDAPHSAAAMPADAPALDGRSPLSHIHFPPGFRARRGPVAALLYVAETLIILAAAQFHSVNAAIAFFVAISFTANSTHSLLGTAAAMDIGGRKMTGFASGVIDSFQYFGGSLAGWVLGSIIDQFSWGSYFYFMAPFGILGAALMFTMGDKIVPAAPVPSAPHRGFEVVPAASQQA